MAIKFVNLLSKYLPAHFKIAPKDVEVYLGEFLEQVPIKRTRYLLETLNPDSVEISYSFGDNLNLFKDKGVVKIENEYIKYDYNDVANHKLMNLTRGYFGTEAVAHCNEVLWSATLAKDLDAYSTTIEFTSVTNMDKIPSYGQFAILSDAEDLEIISYENFNQFLSGYQFTNTSRGVVGSVAGACNHIKGSYIQEYANLTIEQVDSVRYDKGLWAATLASTLTETAKVAVVNSTFTAKLTVDISDITTEIPIDTVVGTVPTNGYIKIGNEIIRYGYYDTDRDLLGNDLKSGTLSQCIRATQNTRAVQHVALSTVYHTYSTTGEFLIDDEYIQYTSFAYDTLTGYPTFSGLLRGRYETVPTAHEAGTNPATLTERRHTELESSGVFRIGNEYFKYWYLDDEYFYIDHRPALNAKTYYHTSSTAVTSIIEQHDPGALITTYHFDDENSYLVDFIHNVAEHMDLAINTKIGQFENFSDVDKVDMDYLKYIVKEIGENLDDYQNLPFFAGTDTIANTDYRIRLFTKELVNIYKEKGLISALKLWHIVISEPLKSYQDLWTFNYCSFYSLPFLILILYESVRQFYPNNENFFRPQISVALQEELAEFYENKKISTYTLDYFTRQSVPVPNLKLIVHDWEYFCKTDNDVKSSDGGTFDSKIISCDTENNVGIFYDQNNVTLQKRDDATPLLLPFYVEDHDVDLFKFEEELDATKTLMPDSAVACYPTTTDEGLISDYSFEWIRDIYTLTLLDYCNLVDRLLPIRTDLTVLKDLTSDISNAAIELVHNTTATEDNIVVKVTDGKLYDPDDHIVAGTFPRIPPKGFVKFGDEIISYTGLEFYDHHEGVFIGKNYLLTGCARGINSTPVTSYKINLYEGNERLLAGNYVTVIYEPTALYCLSDPVNNILTCVDETLTAKAHNLEKNDIVLFDPRGFQGIPYEGVISTWPTDPIPYYYYVYKLTAETFQISLTPITGTLTPVNITGNTPATCHKIWFRLNLTRDPKTYGVSDGDYLQLVQTGYNYRHLIVDVVNSYNYCSEEYTYGIDFVTGILPIPTVKTETATGLPSLAPVDDYPCVIDEVTFRITPKIYTNTDDDGNPIYLPHDLSQGDTIYFLQSVGNINAYQNYYVSYAAEYYFEIASSMTPWLKSLEVLVDNTWHSTAGAHGLNNGDLVMFSTTDFDPLTGKGVYQGLYYIVSNVNVAAHTFKIRLTTVGDVVPLLLGNTNTIDYSTLPPLSIKNPLNSYMVSGTRVTTTIPGYQHRYSLIQHILWRLDNEVNGNDMPLVYGLTSTQLAEKKLDTYTGVKDGIIWPTPHFKYEFDVISTTNAGVTSFPPNDVIDLVLKKLKEYKPKHTVADLTFNYSITEEGNYSELASVGAQDSYETENLMSDAYQRFNGTTLPIVDRIMAYNHDLRENSVIYIEGGNAEFVFGTPYYVRYVSIDTFQVSTLASFDGTTEPFGDTIRSNAHGLLQDDPVDTLNGDAVGLISGTTYYVQYIDADYFKLLSFVGGPVVDITGTAIVVIRPGLPIDITVPAQTVWITQAPSIEHRIELNHTPLIPAHVDYSYDLPIITLDKAIDYGANVYFAYTWRDGTEDEYMVQYFPFTSYPCRSTDISSPVGMLGLMTDVYRNRKRFLNYVDYTT